MKLDPRDARRYLERDRDAVSRSRAAYWARRASLGPAEVLRVMSDLRDHARALRPDWPTAEERAEDVQAHRRVAEALSKVSPAALRRRRRPGRVR